MKQLGKSASMISKRLSLMSNFFVLVIFFLAATHAPTHAQVESGNLEVNLSKRLIQSDSSRASSLINSPDDLMVETAATALAATSQSGMPTLEVQPATEIIVGKFFSVSWKATNAVSLQRICTAKKTGYKSAKGLELSGKLELRANADWVGYPSTCIWTATAEDGQTATYTETMTTMPAPPSAACISATPASGVYTGYTGVGGWNVWGDNVIGYSVYSDISRALVHAGLLNPGVSGKITITPLGELKEFKGSTANGITTYSANASCGMRLTLEEKYDQPTITVSPNNGTLIAGKSWGVRWKTTNAVSVVRTCSAMGTGYNETRTFGLNGFDSQRAKPEWVNYPSTCIWTATAADGRTATVEETITTITDPTSGPTCADLTPASGIYVGSSKNGHVWGNNVTGYTADSDVGKAAVHAGLLKDGISGRITITSLDQLESFSGSTENGISSESYELPLCGMRLAGEPVVPQVRWNAPTAATTLTTATGFAPLRVSGTVIADGSINVTSFVVLDNGKQIYAASNSAAIDTTLSMPVGKHRLILRAISNVGTNDSVEIVIDVISRTSGDNAVFVLQDVPPTVRAGEPYSFTVQMLNTGSTTWTESAGYRLGSQNQQDNRTWGGRLYLSRDVAGGETGIFTVTTTAPQEPGIYDFQWQMLREHVSWFGEKSVNATVQVSAGIGPTAMLSGNQTNIRVTGAQAATVTLTGSGSRSGGLMSKLELFQSSGTGYGATPIKTQTGSTATLNLSATASLGAGIYSFKLRSTDGTGLQTESRPVIVNVTNSALLGSISGVRTNAGNGIELFGWACQPNSATPLNYKVLVDAPSLDAGASLLTTGVANVKTEADSSTVESQCGTPGTGHHFVVDLSSYIAAYAGRRLYVWAETENASSTVSLPCADNTCTMPGTLRVAMTTPGNFDLIPAPGPVFMRAKLSQGSGTYDVGFVLNGEYIAAQPDTEAGTYIASKSGLAASVTPYTVFAKVRQGDMTLMSVQNQFAVVNGIAATVRLDGISSGTTLALGATQTLRAATTGTSVQTLKFYANNGVLGSATRSGDSWTLNWTPAAAGTYTLLARAYDASGTQLAESPGATLTVIGASDATPIPVDITPPYLDSADTGTLPGTLAVGDDGAATYKIDIVIPPGTAGMQPQLSLNYSSSSLNGMVGLGWSLGGLSTIHRCSKTVAQDGVVGRIGFDASDRLCLDGVRLLRADGTNPGTDPAAQDAAYWASGAQYRTELEGFSLITKLSNGFKVELKDGRIQYYGQNAETGDTTGAVPAQGRTDKFLLWALARIEDRSGNYMKVQYTTDTETGEYLPTQILYGGNTAAKQQPDLAVRFSYELRPDAQVQYMGGSRNDLRSRLTHVTTFIDTAADGSNGKRVRDYIVTYSTSKNSYRSLVESVKVCATSDEECLPKTSFYWGSNSLKLTQKKQWKQTVNGDNETHPYKVVSGDFAGNGATISLYPQPGTPQCPLCQGDKIYPFTGNMNGPGYFAKLVLPSGSSFSEAVTGDLNGDGQDDIIVIDVKSRLWAYCLALPPGTNGTLNFADCKLGPEPLPTARIKRSNPADLPNLVSLQNDGKFQIVALDGANKVKICSYVSSGMSCTVGTYSMPADIPVFDIMPVSLSKQGMTDFYSVWFDENKNSSGVVLCNFYSGSLACKTVATGGGRYSSSVPADLNGDGLTDFMYSSTNGGNVTCVSKESDVDCATVAVNDTPSGQHYLMPGIGDFTGNGINYFASSTVNSAGKSVQTLCHVLDKTTTCVPIDTGSIPDVLQKFTYPAEDSSSILYIDNTGVPAFQLCTIPYYETNHYEQECITFTAMLPANEDKLTAVVNGIGRRDEVDYARSDDATVYSPRPIINGSVQQPVYPQLSSSAGVMVKELRRSNGQSGWLKYDYRYAGAMRDGFGRGSLGFAKVIVKDPNGLSSETNFSQEFPFVGMTTRFVRFSSSCTLEETANILEQRPFSLASGSQSFFVDVSQTDSTRRDLDCSDLGTIQTANQYTDNWGNLNTQTITSKGAGETFVVKNVSVFNTEGNKNYLSGLPTSVTVTKTNSSNVSLTRKISYTHNAVTGLLETETIEPSNDSYKLVTTYDRASTFGVVNKQTQSWKDPACADPKGLVLLSGACVAEKSRVIAEIEYDGKGRFPKKILNALKHEESRSYDPASGEITQRTDANKLATNWSLDSFGRIIVERIPGGNEKRSYFKKCDEKCVDGAAFVNVVENYNGTSRIATPSVTYIDSAGHTLRTLEWGFDGSEIVTDQRYDALGRLSETDWPKVNDQSAYLSSRKNYDDLNRVISIVLIDESGNENSTKTEFHGFETTRTNAKSQATTESRDVIGQLRKMIDSNTPSGSTKFEYDPFGNLEKVVDPLLNEVSVTYDLLGRRTDLRDPDLGWIHYDVDPLGQVWAQTTPKQRSGKKTYMAYDLLGRMTGRYEPDLESHWSYDTASTGIGQVAKAITKTLLTKDDYSRTHAFDVFGRPTTTTLVLGDSTYISKVDYDDWGRRITNTYRRNTDVPKVFGTRYNAYGYLKSIERGSLVLWKINSQDAVQRPTEFAFGNGLMQTRTFSPQSGRLQYSALVTAEKVGRLQEGYSYDKLGNVLGRTQYWDTGGFIEDFTYDSLSRLQTSQVQGKLLQTFEYDATGNIISKTGVGTYTYPPQGSKSVQPHAVTKVSSQSKTFEYDVNGNLTAGAGMAASWTSFDMPSSITKGSNSASFIYGPEHQRVRQDRSDGTSVMYAGAQEVEMRGNVVTLVKTYWPSGIGVEIDRGSNSSLELNWMHADRLGSVVALTDESGALREKLAYDAWGKRRSVDDNYSTPDTLDGKTDNRGFTGHEMLDQLDLVHMNGRVYDPAIARVMSPDPLITRFSDGQSWNRYSYVFNSPTKFVDPTGFTAEGCPSPVNCGQTIAQRLIGEASLENTVFKISSGLRQFVNSATSGGSAVLRAAATRALPLVIPLSKVSPVQKGIGSLSPSSWSETDTMGASLDGRGRSRNDPMQASNADQGTDGDQAGSKDIKWAETKGTPDDPNDPDPERKDSLRYAPTRKHEKGGWGTEMDLNYKEGQQALNNSVEGGKQRYAFQNGRLYEFQPDNTGGWHGYPIRGNEAPTSALRQLLRQESITKAEYMQLIKGK